MSPYELLALRHPDYAKAQERHLRALEQQRVAAERVQALERDLAAAEEEDDQPPAGQVERVRIKLDKAKAEGKAFESTVARTGRAVDRLPAEHRGDWLRQAHRDFQEARAECEQFLGRFIEARTRLEQEAQLLNFLVGQTNSVRVPHTLRVHVGGVEGLMVEAPTRDVLEALHHAVLDIEVDALLRARP